MVLVPFGPLRWYRLVRYDGTDCSATVVPIRPLRWYRLTDTIIFIAIIIYIHINRSSMDFSFITT